MHGGAPSLTMLRAMTHPIRRLSRPALLLTLALLAALVLPERSLAAQTPCPTFQIQHNDRIGKLRLRAGTYDILIGNQRKLSCSSASDHFRQFLEDYDGTLPDGWRVQARKSRFVQRSSGDAFRVRRVRGGGPHGRAGLGGGESAGQGGAEDDGEAAGDDAAQRQPGADLGLAVLQGPLARVRLHVEPLRVMPTDRPRHRPAVSHPPGRGARLRPWD